MLNTLLLPSTAPFRLTLIWDEISAMVTPLPYSPRDTKTPEGVKIGMSSWWDDQGFGRSPYNPDEFLYFEKDPEQIPDIEVRMKASLQGDGSRVFDIVWSTKRGLVSKELFSEFGELASGLLTPEQITMKKAELAILRTSTLTPRRSGNSFDHQSRIKRIEEEIRTGKRIPPSHVH